MIVGLERLHIRNVDHNTLLYTMACCKSTVQKNHYHRGIHSKPRCAPVRSHHNKSDPAVFVVIYNELQYTLDDTSVIGVYEELGKSFIGGWKTIIEQAMKPWSIEHYKDMQREFAYMRGMGKYHIEEWDASKSTRVNVYTLGDCPEGTFDGFLKENYADCEVILQELYAMLVEQNELPDVLRKYTKLKSFAFDS